MKVMQLWQRLRISVLLVHEAKNAGFVIALKRLIGAKAQLQTRGSYLTRILLLICLAVMIWTPAVEAATSSRLEEQVLQIIREHPEAIIESVQTYQQKKQSALQGTRQAFLQDLKTNPQTVIDASPVTKNPVTKTVLMEFSDFQCPFCAEAHKTLKNLLVKYPDKFTLVYKHFPLVNSHAQAMPAAQAAWAAQQQGKFWEYEDALFTNQKKLGEDLYLDIAKKLNLDFDKFKSDRLIANAAIQKDISLAMKLGVSGTPFFVISSETLAGEVELPDIEKLISG
jgi:protein-disulfide isomerase